MANIDSERTRYDTDGNAWIVDIDLANELHKKFTTPVNGNYRFYIGAWITFAQKYEGAKRRGDMHIIDRNGKIYDGREWGFLPLQRPGEKAVWKDVVFDKLIEVYQAARDYDLKIKS